MAGRIEVICGPMYSGKTEELIRRLNIRKIQQMNIFCFKPEVDDRWDYDRISSRSGLAFRAVTISDSAELKEYISPEVNVVGLDEAQFFDKDLPYEIQRIADKGVQVFITGLDTDYRRLPFGPMPQLLAIADKVDKFQAVCHSCLGEAVYTQRLIDGVPASFKGPTIQVGDSESYEARCRNCFEPG